MSTLVLATLSWVIHPTLQIFGWVLVYLVHLGMQIDLSFFFYVFKQKVLCSFSLQV